MGEHPKSCGSGWHSRPCAPSMRIPTSWGFYRHFQSVPLSVCGSLMLQKNPPLCPYQRKIKSHAWMTGGPLLWHPSSASVLRDSSETTFALCCLLHWTHYNLHTAVTVPQTMLLPSPCTLLSPTWKIRTPMWGCCSWIIVQHLTPQCLPHWLRSSRLWDWTDLCAAGSWTSWQAEVRWSEWATIPHLLWSSTLVLRWAASSAHSCTPAASDPALADWGIAFSFRLSG